MKLALAAPLALLLATATPAQAPSRAVTAALADPSRPAADRARDGTRKAGELLAFTGIKPGDKVADFIMGGGYWTPILSALVGPKGRVYAYQPAEFIGFRPAYGTDQDAAVKGRANVTPTRDSLRAAAFPEPLDAILTVQNWHDLHLKLAPPGTAAAIARHLYDVLKPGGVLVVVDHVGAPGTADALHRGDPAGTRAEIEAAGFRLAAQSRLYANPADPKTAIVFDPSIRGRTDQFAYKFSKPR